MKAFPLLLSLSVVGLVWSFRLPSSRTSLSVHTLRASNNRNSEGSNPITGEVPNSIRESYSQGLFRALKTAGVSAGALLGLSAATAFSSSAEAAVDGFIETESGLQYKDTKVGDGDAPLPGDTVRVHYTGWLEDFESEKKFDSSYDRRSPLNFKVGVRQVIAGWDEALLTNMKVGGKRDIIIPPSLGYGSRGAGGVIPPNATLYFKIELVGIGAKANR